jgi:hypothetical protein
MLLLLFQHLHLPFQHLLLLLLHLPFQRACFCLSPQSRPAKPFKEAGGQSWRGTLCGMGWIREASRQKAELEEGWELEEELE